MHEGLLRIRAFLEGHNAICGRASAGMNKSARLSTIDGRCPCLVVWQT